MVSIHQQISLHHYGPLSRVVKYWTIQNIDPGSSTAEVSWVFRKQNFKEKKVGGA